MRDLKGYETISGKLINKEKSCFYMFHKVEARLVEKVEQITGLSKGNFPFKYLGCPIFHNRKRKEYYNDLIKKVKDRLQNWRGKLLSSGDKVVLIEKLNFFMDSSGWKREKLHQYLPELVVEHAHKKLQYEYISELSDHPWWMKTSYGKFSVSSAWEEIRQKGHKKEEYVSIWCSGVPKKFVSFCGG
ncbi:hypothetical protein H5410_036690 [Solanum commersonii]|uniref:Reverse transcriptase n=1 Tax=Solanum commersonii TaxID=4109 RepID=A0A9J5Y602_SOLCO|nr:hypothetical protein H5410_036690 [Solanum commersonii]